MRTTTTMFKHPPVGQGNQSDNEMGARLTRESGQLARILDTALKDIHSLWNSLQQGAENTPVAGHQR